MFASVLLAIVLLTIVSNRHGYGWLNSFIAGLLLVSTPAIGFFESRDIARGTKQKALMMVVLGACWIGWSLAARNHDANLQQLFAIAATVAAVVTALVFRKLLREQYPSQPQR